MEERRGKSTMEDRHMEEDAAGRKVKFRSLHCRLAPTGTVRVTGPPPEQWHSLNSKEEQSGLGTQYPGSLKQDEDINTGTVLKEKQREDKEMSKRKGSEKEEGNIQINNEEGEENDGIEEEENLPCSTCLSLSFEDTLASTPSSSSSSSSYPSLPIFSLPPSSSSPLPLLSPPLPPRMELSVVLADTRLTLDVYQGGAAVLPALWKAVPEQVRRVQYLRLGSEDSDGLGDALSILPRLTQLRSLAIRGHCLQDSRGDPLPGVLSALPGSFSFLTSLTHLDLSFNRLASLPSCLLALPLLSSLLLSHNLLSTLPPSIGSLHSLRYLSLLGNRLQTLPPSLGRLVSLQTLDLSHNLLESLPEEVGQLECLSSLELSHNMLKVLPETLGSLLSLRELIIHSNDIRSIPECLKKLPLLTRLDTRNNPLGQPPTPPPAPLPTSGQTETELPELHLGLNQHCFSVSAAGCHVFLPRGAELLFPPGCVAETARLKWAERRPDRKWVWLEEHEFLLSQPLELLPHGITFLKPVEVCLSYHRSRRREVVVRRFDGQSWSTLLTVTRRGSQRHSVRPGGRPARFSWFVVVSRLVRDTCSVPPEGALLVSRVDPGIKLTFPPSATVQTRSVTLQVLQVLVSEVRQFSGDPQASASPLLCVSQSPSLPFLRPVTVQVPLPPGLTGHTVDVSCLYLLHGDPLAQIWTDVTAQASLQITQLYAIFTVTHFSWYWLWYTTQRCVSGMVRKVYHRLRQFRVQFLVLQRKSDPMQVLLQCLPTGKVDGAVQSLSAQYEGPQPSDLCELLEGEQFFAGFERGIEINTDRPDCVKGRLSFIFYSHLKNHKEVYICPSQGKQEPVRGQGILSDKKEVEALRHPPLNLGDPESGYLTEANLLAISLQIGQDWRSIGINLGMSYQELDRIQYKHRDNLGAVVLDMLFHWAGWRGGEGPGAVPELVEAMIDSGRRDLADEIEDIVKLGKRKYRDSLRRVGLDADASSVVDE
ncbi:hypothetical protein JZ751_002680 [Albula glossodonta]|uniref:P53-induced death domain protein 1 n=1 Tax=Albula glossodonta TaxID=121402 RepID=A0A8T2N7M6_9TELE|nr:hypothetical protein JZ751_002680 [Albula glossodonta]